MANQLALQERVFKALANRRRIAIVMHLKKHREATVGEMAEAIQLSFKATSKHLGILVNANVVDKEQRGLEVFCVLSGDMPTSTRSIVSLL